ncbi:MAG: NUDIX domain-containing protein [Legionella sp.]|jgi:ADP-ribose pyrophosphatase YjhB (NUDIX family)
MGIRTTLYKMANRVIKKSQSFLGFKTIGARAIVLNEEGKILLVKHTYQPHWFLPGGGVDRGETVKSALIRELKEEVGLAVNEEEPVLFGVYYNTYMNVPDYPVIYVVKKYTEGAVYSGEIEDKGWFSYEALHEMVSPGTKRRLDEYFGRTGQSQYW